MRTAMVGVLVAAAGCVAPRESLDEHALNVAPASSTSDPLRWRVELSGFACAVGEGNYLQGYSASQIVRGCCDGRCFAATVDGAGKPTGQLPPNLGIPELDALDEVRSVQGEWPNTWVALRDRFERPYADARLSAAGYTEMTLREIVYSHSDGRWAERYRSEGENIEVVAGVGPWLGGTTIAAVRPAGWGGGAQRILVLSGDPATNVPSMPPISEVAVTSFSSLASGHAFAIGSANAGLRLLRTMPGSSGWTANERNDLASAQIDEGPVRHATLAVRSTVEAYAAVLSRGGNLKVLRFDGVDWADSGELAGMHFRGFAFGQDGTTWALTWQGAGAGVWRRPAGPAAAWSRVAGDAIGDGADIEPEAILPAAHRDLLVVGRLRDKGWGLYRVTPESSRDR